MRAPATLVRAAAAQLLFAELGPEFQRLELRAMWRLVPRSTRAKASLQLARRYAPKALNGLPRSRKAPACTMTLEGLRADVIQLIQGVGRGDLLAVRGVLLVYSGASRAAKRQNLAMIRGER